MRLPSIAPPQKKDAAAQQEGREQARRAAFVCIPLVFVCAVLLFLPPFQRLLLSLLARLKGGSLRRPELWAARMREAGGLLLAAGSLAAALLCAGKSRRRQAVHVACLAAAFLLWTLFPLGSRIAFLQFFKGLSAEQAADFQRLDALLYKVLCFSACFFLLAFLAKNATFSMRTLLQDRQFHAAAFSLVLIISFASFYIGIPAWIKQRGTLWFYALFDYNDFTLSIGHRGPNGSYPPLANILTGLFKVFAYDRLQVAEAGKGGYSVLSPLGSFMILLFFLTHLLPLMLICQRAIGGSGFTKGLFSFAACTSSFVVYAVMRGNIILLALVCSLYYMVFYDDEDKKLRKTALFALALAANIKVYPAVFGCLLLKQKRWKDIGLCILYSSLLFFPLFFTYDAGFSPSFGRFMHNLNYAGSDRIVAPGQDAMEFEEAEAALPRGGGALIKAFSASTFGIFSLSAAVSAFAKSLQLPANLYRTLLSLIYLLYAGLSLLLFIKARRKWCLLLVPATACYLLPGMTYVYVPVFLLLPLIALLNEENKRPAEYAAMLIFLSMFACNWTTWPYVLGYKDFPSLIFTIGLFVTAFLTEKENKTGGVPSWKRTAEPA